MRNLQFDTELQIPRCARDDNVVRSDDMAKAAGSDTATTLFRAGIGHPYSSSRREEG